MSDVPDEAREAALLALATKFALIESPVNLVVDAVLDAAAPFLVAAERQRLHDRIEALADECDAHPWWNAGRIADLLRGLTTEWHMPPSGCTGDLGCEHTKEATP